VFRAPIGAEVVCEVALSYVGRLLNRHCAARARLWSYNITTVQKYERVWSDLRDSGLCVRCANIYRMAYVQNVFELLSLESADVDSVRPLSASAKKKAKARARALARESNGCVAGLLRGGEQRPPARLSANALCSCRQPLHSATTDEELPSEHAESSFEPLFEPLVWCVADASAVTPRPLSRAPFPNARRVDCEMTGLVRAFVACV